MSNPLKSANEDYSKNPVFVTETIECITDIASMGATVPQTADEYRTRINEYFSYCSEHHQRPGIESLSLSLGLDRRRFNERCHGSKGQEIQEICVKAKQCVISFIESAMNSGKLNPAAAIFSLKNVAGWQDSVSIETITTDNKESTLAELPDLSKLMKIESEESGE